MNRATSHARVRLVWLLLAAAAPLAVVRAEQFHGRNAWVIRNGKMQVTVTPGGGHIAGMTLLSGRGANLNPLWVPPWKSVEPGAWARNPDAYGGKPAAQLLSTILGHNICLDFFGAPSGAETTAGIPVHGEAPTVNWRSESRQPDRLTYSTKLPLAQMDVTRTISLTPNASTLWITETIVSQSRLDRPIGWQQHPTFGPPFLENGASRFDMPARWSMVYPKEFSKGERLVRGAEFDWPNAPGKDGQVVDLREWPKGSSSSDYTASLIDASKKWGWFTAVNTRKGLLCGYIWPRADWPWVGNWEENHFRSGKPWLKKAVTRGMEFGTTPFPDSRRDAVKLGTLHGVPTYRWISAQSRQSISYGAFLAPIPQGTTGVKDVELTAREIRIQLDGVDRTITLPIRR